MLCFRENASDDILREIGEIGAEDDEDSDECDV